MPYFDSNSIKCVALHRVGNKQTEEGFVLSDKLLRLNEQLQDLLVQYFITPFKVEEYYNLFHEDNVELNQVFHSCADIFDLFQDTVAERLTMGVDDIRKSGSAEDVPEELRTEIVDDTLSAAEEHAEESPFALDPELQKEFLEKTKHIARWLYEACTHPNIKGGDVFVVFFDKCMINGETTDAVGIFKSENKDPFLKVLHGDEQWSRQEGDMSAEATFRLEVDKGINIHKLDKGALIFNSERENGFVVSVVDATNRGADAMYWKDNFLQIRQRQDQYYNTREVMTAYKQFVTDELPQQYEVTKADQADLLNKSVQFFKQNDNFDMEDFARDVIGQPEVIESFAQFKETYEKENEIELPDQFQISDDAVKKQARAFKSVIKLDKNFHIYVHGDSKLIEQGEDERGKFYKVYYNEES